MTEGKITPPQGDALRRRAESELREKAAGRAENVEALSPAETRKTLHDLRVHQIELEMQNEELRRAQTELETMRARYFDLYDLAPIGYCTLSEKGLILEANLTAANLLGVSRSDLAKQPLSRFVLKEDEDIYYLKGKHLLETGEPQACELRMVKKNGTEFWARMDITAAQDTDGAPVCRTVISDISVLKGVENNLIKTVQQLQETMDMLVQFGKEAAIGRLAAGVSHEILNPASIISSQLQFLEKESLSEPARRNVLVSREQLQRIVNISQDLQQSFPKLPGMLVRGDLRDVVEVGLQMTKRRREEDHVLIEYDPPLKFIAVKMAKDSLVKVLVHLILNACDAMTVNKEKRLIVTIQYHEDSSKCLSVHLTVADNGHGIPAGYLNRIFDPFFTTKDPGKGTGLGLSICRGIIFEHGGAIRAENNDMGGASFIVELPL
ncbi:MAG: ATP-binding protein [Syntrophus sp. (in: bacteria)]